MSRYRQTMSEALEQVRQQFTEDHSDKDFKPYPDWKKTAGGRYPRFKHSQKGEIQVDRYGEWLHSDKSGKTIAFYRNHFPKTNTTGGTSMKLTDYLKKINEEVINEVSDHEVSMARGELEAIADKATQLAGALQGKSDEGNPLEAWVQSKITKAKDYINSVSDYMMYKPENAKEEVELEEKNTDKYVWSDINTAMMRAGFSPGMIMKVLSGLRGKELSEELEEAKIISDISGVSINKLKQEVMPFSVNEKTYGWTLVSKAKDLAKKFANNITKAVDEIEKLEKGLSKNSTVAAELRKYNESLEEKFTVQITKKDGTTMELGRYNTAAEAQRFVDMYGKGAKVKKEEVELEEASLKDIFTANQEGKKADEIAKKLGMSVSDIKKILGEEMGEVSEENLDEFTSDMIKRLKKSYSTMPQKLSTDQANALSRHLDRLDLTSLKQLAKEKIPFITTLARNKIYKKTGKFEQIEEQDGVEIAKIRADRDEKDKKEVDSKEKEVESLKNQVAMLKTKLENEKNRAIKPEPNPETGEVPLTIGIANKLLKDKAEKEAKKKEVKEERRLYVEAIAGLQKKADKSGMPYSILKKVYDRGMAAWKGGHRPGASQHQWAFARVNSFVTKSSGTWGGADKDLAKQVKG